jgi:Rrf2 family iron-sulfur cluster assembly transcriptional regulator
MIFTKTTTYAIRIMICMAGEERAVFPAHYLYQHLGIHNRYLRRLLTSLTKEGFIVSTRGKNGGFALARPADQIFLSEIIQATEGLGSISGCIMGVTNCRRKEKCVMHNLWEETKVKLLAAFSGTSVKKLAMDGVSMNYLS